MTDEPAYYETYSSWDCEWEYGFVRRRGDAEDTAWYRWKVITNRMDRLAYEITYKVMSRADRFTSAVVRRTRQADLRKHYWHDRH